MHVNTYECATEAVNDGIRCALCLISGHNSILEPIVTDVVCLFESQSEVI